MHFFIVTVSSPTVRGDKYLVRCKDESPDAAVRYAQRAKLVSRGESVKAEPATVELLAGMRQWKRNHSILE